MRRGTLSLSRAPSLSPIPLTSRAPLAKCSTGCLALDSVLGGGIPCGCITEIVGESASAKTQLALQLLLAVQMPLSSGGLQGKALYLFTEAYFPDRRLQQLARFFKEQGRFEEHRDHQGVVSSKDAVMQKRMKRSLGESPTVRVSSFCENIRPDRHEAVENQRNGEDDPCDNILVQGVQEVGELFHALEHLHILLTHPSAMPIRLIVVDSVAALFRSVFDNTMREMSVRTNLFFRLSSILKLYAEQFNLAVVVTNQVVDVMEDQMNIRMDQTPIGNGGMFYTSGRMVAPALGLSWANCVNIRLFLSRWDDPDDSVETAKKKEVSMLNSVSDTGPIPEGRISEISKPNQSKGLEFDSPLRLEKWLEDQEAHESAAKDKCQKDLQSEESEANFAAKVPLRSSSSRFTTSRKLHVIFAPHLPLRSCEFVVKEGGIHGIIRSTE